MTSESAFGSYIPGDSVVHKTKAQVKIILACAFSIGIFFVDSWPAMGVVALVLLCGYLVARVPLARALRGLGPVTFILVFTVVAHCLNFTLEGLLAGLLVAARIAILVIACSLLTFTTSQRELVQGLGWILRPLAAVRVPVSDVVLIASLALSFVPVTTREAYLIRKAQMSRCADFDSGSILGRARAWVPVLVPLMVRLFRRSEELAQALVSRCYTGKT